eukprot:sb/3478778/
MVAMVFMVAMVTDITLPRIAVDGEVLAKTSSKAKSSDPSWNEVFTLYILSGHKIGLTIFHNAIVPPDPFISHTDLDLCEMMELPPNELWVSYNTVIQY